jgi:urease accessory protein
MLRLTRIVEAPDAAPPAGARVLRLTHEERARSRLAGVCEDGTACAVLLPRGTVLRDGMLLADEAGACVRVVAAPQPLARVSADSPLALLRVVYHLANRHVAAQLAADSVLIERDAVIERMLAALGARIDRVEAPFEPEPGAFAGHGHAHAHDHDDTSATLGERLSIEAHRARGTG